MNYKRAPYIRGRLYVFEENLALFINHSGLTSKEYVTCTSNSLLSASLSLVKTVTLSQSTKLPPSETAPAASGNCCRHSSARRSPNCSEVTDCSERQMKVEVKRRSCSFKPAFSSAQLRSSSWILCNDGTQQCS